MKQQFRTAKKENFDFDSILNELKQFDLNTKYGPCAGISRRERWERANKLGLAPPIRIIEILETKSCRDAIPDIDESLWFGRI